MSAPKAGTYVLAATVFHRTEGEGDEKRRVRYKRGDRVELSKAEAARLAVSATIGKRIVPAAFVLASNAGDVPAGDDLATGTPVVTPEGADPVAQVIVELGIGEGGGGGGADLTGGQGTGGDGSQQGPDGSDNGGQQGTKAEDRPPARAANLPVWQAYAVKVGAATEAEAAEMTKAALQEAVANKLAGG
ncbi:hypothetical protein [Mycolicibacterium llatzerense]|uniref:hypothetical protein n=1 Tax=Mycolicibacterium llatzerense TaxID=280871 RepID=UPI0021B55B03|nr:hypothetical protein [Mycolicibacterium llatzerense]MCT7372696.1 hypothetical protein [Mycolicibacterium llatzerense]